MNIKVLEKVNRKETNIKARKRKGMNIRVRKRKEMSIKTMM